MPQQYEIRCVICRTPVSAPITELEDLSRLNREDGSPYVPRGCFITSNGNNHPGTEGQPIVNLEDLRSSKHHNDQGRLNGCCGLDGCDGFNTMCINGHEIGTECSDCWMPHCFYFDPKLIEFIMVH